MAKKKTSTKKDTKKTVTKKVEKKVEKKTTAKKQPVVLSATPKKSIAKPEKKNLAPKNNLAAELFKDNIKIHDRIFLRAPKKYADIPDLLDLQRRGYESFINYHIHKLFDLINPVRDIA